MKKHTRVFVIVLAAVLLISTIVIGGVFVLREQNRKNELQRDMVAELTNRAGEYDPQSIVLRNTTEHEAKTLAEKLGAKLRITASGKFATLTLDENTTVLDVFSDDEYIDNLEIMSADWHVDILDFDEAPYMPEMPEDMEEQENRFERIVSRPLYDVNDDGYAAQTYLDYLNLRNVWTRTKGAGVTVAVIDTGIDTDHPEFAGRISEYSYNASSDRIVKDYLTDESDSTSYDWSLIEDEVGHGTSVAGVIAAAMDGQGIVGIAPDVNIIVIKADCLPNGQFKRTSDLVFGLYYAIERDVDVINMSFGTYGANPFAEPAQLAVDSDIICVAAAGNDQTASAMYPAADTNVIGVGALENGSWELAEYSNFGVNSDIVTPGTTYTTAMGGQYSISNGTSLASPAAAGVIALYLSLNEYVELNDLRKVMYAACYDLGDLGEDTFYGFGAIDASAMILEERGTVTFDYLTDEIDNTNQVFIREHTLQDIPEPDRLYAVFDGWYYDPQCTEKLDLYKDEFSADLTLYANWVNEDDGVPYTYVVLDDGTIEIRSYTGHRRYITIPDYIDGRIVSSIGENAFSEQTRLREVNLPKYLRIIKAGAFSSCENLIKMSIPEYVYYIGASAFIYDSRMTQITFEGTSSVAIIEEESFAYTSIYDFNLPASVYSIAGNAFLGCQKLMNISVDSENENYIAPDGVLHNISLTEIVAYPAGRTGEYELLPSVNTIGAYAFGYAKLTSIEFSGVKIINEGAFMYSRIEAVDIPDSVYHLGGGAFAYCRYLTDLHIGSGLTEIDVLTFAGCSSLKPFTIPSNIIAIECGAFFAAGMPTVYFTEDSNLFYIGGSGFACSGLQTIRLPKSLASIGIKAFYECTDLAEVTFEEDCALTSIGSWAFEDTFSLQSILLPDKLKTTGEYVFLNSGLTGEVLIPASLEEYGVGLFAACKWLTDIKVDSGNKYYKDIGGVVFTNDEKTLIEYPAGNARTEYSIMEGVDTVFDSAFYGTRALINAYLPESLVYIQRYGFYECESLAEMHFPANLMQISNYAFANDTKLHHVYFAENIKLPRLSYASFAFTGLEEITIPGTVSTIAQRVFEGCESLSSITFEQNSKIRSISAYMFDGCSNLETITFLPGSQLTNIQAHALEGMRRLRSIDFGDAQITNIDNFAFRFCESLTEFNIPEGTTYLGRYAFYQCTGLSTVTLPESLAYIGRFAFLGTNDCNLYFAAEYLPGYLQEDWDYGIAGYYLGTSEVINDGDYTYAKLKSGNVAIIKYNGTDKNIDLTALDFGGNITVIGGKAFYFSDVESITLPQTLTLIQPDAFFHTNLRGITIPENVTFIGKNAFAYTPLQTVTFAGNSKLTVIEQYAFEETKQLTQIVLPGSLMQLGRGVFKSSGLTSVVFGEGFSMTELPKEMFAYTKLTSVVIPECVTVIWDNAFRETNDLKSLHLPETDDLMIRSNAFYHAGLTEVYIPANVSYIGEYSFIGLRSLKSYSVSEDNEYYKSENGLLISKDGRKLVAVPAGMTGSLEVPLSVEVIGFGAFEDSVLNNITFNKDANILTFGYRAFYNAKNLTAFTVPASVVSIDYYAFANCSNLHTVLFEEGNRLTGIYEGAFIGCSSLQNITLPETVIEISDYAFYGCQLIDRIPVKNPESLRGIYDYALAYTGISGEITMPANLYDIGDHSFEGTALTKVTVPSDSYRELKIGFGAFMNCNQLEEMELPFIGSIYLDTDYTWFGYIFGAGSSSNNYLYVPESLHKLTAKYAPESGMGHIFDTLFERFTELHIERGPRTMGRLKCYDNYLDNGFSSEEEYMLAYRRSLQNFTNIEHITLPVTLINVGGFSGANKLESIVIPDGVRYIDATAFYECTSLKSINIPDSVTTIEEYAFAWCEALESITVPDSVTYMGEFVFSDDHYLTQVKLPDGLTIIPAGTFKSCWCLENVEIPANVTEIGDYAFYNLFVENIVFPDGVTSIGENAFSDCFYLTSINIPKGMKTISRYSFRNCGLTELVIPEGVETIEAYAFCGNQGIHELTLPSTLKYIGEDAFDCGYLYRIHNYSDIELVFGAMNNGRAAANAVIIYDKNGNMHTHDKGRDIITTENGLVFENVDGEYRLFLYIGDEETVILPEEINGHGYILDEFSGARKLVLPSFITEFKYGMLDYTGIESIRFPATTEKIEWDAFRDIYRRDIIGIDVSVDEDNPYFTEIDGVLYSKDITKCIRFLPNFDGNFVIPETVTEFAPNYRIAGAPLKTVIIPNSMSEIPMSAFADCYELETVVLPDTLKEIGVHAFISCTNLKNIEIPESVIHIGAYAFNGCTSLTSITIPEGITTIYGGTFAGCVSLKSIRISKNIRWIDSDAFSGCTQLNIDLGENENFIDENGILYNADKTAMFIVTGASGKVVIPDGITSIPACFFKGHEDITEVVLPDSVVHIGYEAFAGCVSLQRVNIPLGISEISQSAFEGCESLVEISLPDGLWFIGTAAFRGCSSLKNITIPESVGVIEYAAFTDCRSLKSIAVPNSVTEFSSSVFAGCTSLQSFVLPEGITTIKEHLFSGCSSLKNIVIPDGVEIIEYGAFSQCSSVESITLPSSLRTIGEGAFDGQKSSKSVNYQGTLEQWCGIEFEDQKASPLFAENAVDAYWGNVIFVPKVKFYINGELVNNAVINDGVTSINDYAFYNCDSLKSVVIPESVTFIGEHSFTASGIEFFDTPDFMKRIDFSGCENLKTAFIPSGIEYISFNECTDLESVDLPEGLTFIDDNCFSRCISLKSITIPDSVVYIGDSAFAECRSLSDVEFGNGLTEITARVFMGCTSLRYIDIPEGITQLGYASFYNSGLCRINLPESLTYIDALAFNWTQIRCIVNNSGLDIVLGSVNHSEIANDAWIIRNHDGSYQFLEWMWNEDTAFETEDGFIFDLADGVYRLRAYIGNEKTITLPSDVNGNEYILFRMFGGENIVIPDGFTKIDDDAFRDNLFVKTVQIPDSVKYIGNSAFNGCIMLQSFTIPESVESIENSTFLGCVSLQNITIPESVKSIGNSAFEGCVSLQSATVPETVDEISARMFAGCTALETVNLPQHITIIPDNCFNGCASLTDFELNDNITVIEGGAFYNCINLQNIEFPESVVEIGMVAFAGCKSISHIDLPYGITEIQEGTFRECSGLTEIVIPANINMILDTAFLGCSSLDRIVFEGTIQYLGERVFDNTAYFNNQDNWHSGALYLNGHLLRISSDVIISKFEYSVTSDIYALMEQPKLKYATVRGSELYGLRNCSNLETLVFTETPLYGIRGLFEQNGISLTLKTVIFSSGCRMYEDYFQYVTGITIFVEDNEKDCRWDENYPGWSNGNKVYYGDQWSMVNFYDENGMCISSMPYLNSQVIHLPYYKPKGDEYTDYTVEWDLNGDGIADAIPATTGIDLDIRPVLTETEKKYSVIFAKEDGSVLSREMLSYGDIIRAPQHSEKAGYDFVGFKGYAKGMKVTANVVFVEVWEHQGGGHSYVYTHHDASCEQEGYDEYYCPVCGDSYRENITEPTGHSFGEWTHVHDSSCEECGSEKRVCSVCGAEEEQNIPPLGHDYISKVIRKATCTKEGVTEYTCSRCGKKYTENTEVTPHNYERVKKHKSFMQWLLDMIGKYFFGIDREDVYYYRCKDCGHIMTPDEASSAGVLSVRSYCRHTETEIQIVPFGDCELGGMELHICKKCGKTIDAYEIAGFDHEYFEPEWILSDDRLSVTARFVCGICGKEELIETDVTTIVDGEELIYTAQVEFNGKVYDYEFRETLVYYTVRFIDWDDTLISEATYHYGETVTIPADLTRQSDNTYTYEFARWTPFVTKVTGDATYKAVYTPSYIEYTIKFVDWDNTVINEATYHYGDTVTVPSNPSREADETYTYAFAGWDKEITAVSGNAVYIATYIATEKPVEHKDETVALKIDTVNGHADSQTSVLLPKDGKNTPASITEEIKELGYMLGDVNGNGKIDAADYAMEKRHYLRTYTLNEEQMKRGDINGNNKIDASEYAMVKRHYLGTYTIVQPEPAVVPGFDYSEFAIIIVNNGQIVSVNSEIGKSKSDIVIPEGGYVIAIHKDLFASVPDLSVMLENVKSGDAVTLTNVDTASTVENGTALTDAYANVTFSV